jgi:hypothetical protein
VGADPAQRHAICAQCAGPAFRDSGAFYTAMALSWSGYPEIKIYR